MSSKAWIITEGTYSDYHVIAVVTDPAAAKAFRRWRKAQTGRLNDLEMHEVAVWDGESTELQRMLAIPHGTTYRIFFDPSTREMLPGTEEGRYGAWRSGPDQYVDWENVGRCGRWNDVYDFCEVAAQDMDHAVKSAKDRYMQWVANGRPLWKKSIDVGETVRRVVG